MPPFISVQKNAEVEAQEFISCFAKAPRRISLRSTLYPLLPTHSSIIIRGSGGHCFAVNLETRMIVSSPETMASVRKGNITIPS